MAKPARGSEFDLIARYFAPLARRMPGTFGLPDDAASIGLRRGEEAVLTADAMVEGVHYFPDDNLELVARKLLRSNLSDLAAKGAKPIGYLLVAGWRANTTERAMAGFARGLAKDQERFGLGLLGGDTVRTPGPATFAVTAVGALPRGRMILRGGARAGDDIYVSGTIGDAHLGVMIRRKQRGLASLPVAARRFLLSRHQLPEPRLGLGLGLRALASAAADVSDGLLADLGHICTASHLAAEIRSEAIPLSSVARRCVDKGAVDLESLVTGGDDYEIVFTAAPARRRKIENLARRLRLPLTRIGRMVSGDDVKLLDAAGRDIAPRRAGYTHF